MIPGPGSLTGRLLGKPSKAGVALVVLGITLGALVAALYKPQLTTTWAKLSGAQSRQIHFRADHFLLEDASDVKVAGVDVGVVDDVSPAPNGSGAIVTVVVEDDIPQKVGSAPSAHLRPSTLLGGLYYVALEPGGLPTQAWKDTIPPSRTRLPVEVDDVAETLQPPALQGARSAVGQLDATLKAGGSRAVRELLADAPATLGRGARVIEALNGTRKGVDLPRLVGNLQRASAALNEREGQLENTLDDLDTTSAVLAHARAPMSDAIDHLPPALESARAGLRRLNGTLDRLENVAAPALPAVDRLGALLRRTNPVLAEARPVVKDLRHALADTRPLVRDLVPTSRRATAVLDNLRDPVLPRVNGAIKQAVLSPYRGTGPYRHTRGNAPLYKEAGYMLHNLAEAGAYVDPNGHAVAFHPGAGTGTVSGAGRYSVEKMFQHMFMGRGAR